MRDGKRKKDDAIQDTVLPTPGGYTVYAVLFYLIDAHENMYQAGVMHAVQYS